VEWEALFAIGIAPEADRSRWPEQGGNAARLTEIDQMKWVRVIGASLVAAFVVTALTGCESDLERNRKLGVALYKQEKLDDSQVALQKALKDDQFDAVANAYQGMIDYRANHLEQAEYHFHVALNADPSSEEAKAGLTATLIKKGQPDQALDALERAAKMAEKVDDPRWLKSDIKKPYTKQVEEKLFLGKVNDRIRIARTYEKLGDYDNALVYYKKALEMSPDNANELMSIADMAERAGNRAQAREYLAQAYKADPSQPGIA
jgi:tetratricopeptide (TPR) repeat protein